MPTKTNLEFSYISYLKETAMGLDGFLNTLKKFPESTTLRTILEVKLDIRFKGTEKSYEEVAETILTECYKKLPARDSSGRFTNTEDEKVALFSETVKEPLIQFINELYLNNKDKGTNRRANGINTRFLEVSIDLEGHISETREYTVYLSERDHYISIPLNMCLEAEASDDYDDVYEYLKDHINVHDIESHQEDCDSSDIHDSELSFDNVVDGISNALRDLQGANR